MLKIRHVPEQLFDVTIFPVMLTLTFTFLFGGAIAGSTEEYLQYLLPGILVQTVVFTTVYTGVTLNTDIERGVYDRFRSMPVWRPAPLVGALLGDAVRYTVGSIVVIALGLVLGFRPDGGPVGVVAAVVLLLIFSFGLGWIFTLLGLVMRSPNAVMSTGMMVLFPLTFASNIYVDPTTMPEWLQTVVDHNPITRMATATRGLMAGDATLEQVAWVLVGGGGAHHRVRPDHHAPLPHHRLIGYFDSPPEPLAVSPYPVSRPRPVRNHPENQALRLCGEQRRSASLNSHSDAGPRAGGQTMRGSPTVRRGTPPGGHRSRPSRHVWPFIGCAVVLTATLGACGSSGDSSGTTATASPSVVLTSDQLEAALLTVDDLPSRWEQHDSTTRPETSRSASEATRVPLCAHPGPPPAEDRDPRARAAIIFVKSSNQSELSQELGTAPDAEAHYADLKAAISSCIARPGPPTGSPRRWPRCQGRMWETSRCPTNSR